MKKSYLYLFLLIPLIFLSYYFYTEKKSLEKINYEPNLKDIKNLNTSFYSSDNLYDYINGGADKVISYGFIYLKVWQGKKEKGEFSIELYFFKEKEGAKKIYEEYSKKDQKIYKNYRYEIIEDQGITFAGNYFLKINTYPPDINFIEDNIINFLEWAYEKKF